MDIRADLGAVEADAVIVRKLQNVLAEEGEGTADVLLDP